MTLRQAEKSLRAESRRAYQIAKGINRAETIHRTWLRLAERDAIAADAIREKIEREKQRGGGK